MVGSGYGAQADRVGALVMLLVAFVGWVIVRYSQTYLRGERREAHYVRWLLATLAAVLVVVATDHLLVLALAWTATSLTLHRLLTFFGDRPAAVVAAHKKFIVARLADVCMLGATALLWMAYGTPHIHTMLAQAADTAACAPESRRVSTPSCQQLATRGKGCPAQRLSAEQARSAGEQRADDRHEAAWIARPGRAVEEPRQERDPVGVSENPREPCLVTGLGRGRQRSRARE